MINKIKQITKRIPIHYNNPSVFDFNFMNIHHIGLILLGVIYLACVLWTGFYFSPLIANYDFDNRPFLKSHLEIIKNPSADITDTHRIKQTYACLSKMSIFNRNNVYEIMLTDMPDIVQKNPKRIIKSTLISISQDRIKILDNHHRNITQPFVNHLITLFPKNQDGSFNVFVEPYDFYKSACIPIRYFRYNQTYYISPITK